MFQTIEEMMLNYQPQKESKKKKPPEWDKFYTVYMFDFIKYHKLCKEQPRTDRSELKKLCYVYDADGNKTHLGDEKHIYRQKTEQAIRVELAKYAENTLNVFKDSDSVRTKYYTLYQERYTEEKYTHTDILTGKSGIYGGQKFNIIELELNDTWQLPRKTRLLLHLEVLKRCKQGMSIEDACENVLAIHRKEDVMK